MIATVFLMESHCKLHILILWPLYSSPYTMVSDLSQVTIVDLSQVTILAALSQVTIVDMSQVTILAELSQVTILVYILILQFLSICMVI